MKKSLLFLLFIAFSFNSFSQFFEEKTGKKLQEGLQNMRDSIPFYYDENKDKVFLPIEKFKFRKFYMLNPPFARKLGLKELGLKPGSIWEGGLIFFF